MTVRELPEIRFINTVHNLVEFYNGYEDRGFDGKVTVLIPCYKKSHYIYNTTLSCVNQTYKVNVLILLMDEESIALKGKLEKLPGVKCLCSERKSVTNARRFLVDNCNTQWFFFLDGDDELTSTCIETLINNGSGAIRYPACNCDNDYKPEPALHNLERNNITNIIVYNNTALMHKDVFYDIDYDDSLSNGGEDTDFNLRLASCGKWKISFVPDAYYIYKLNTENQLTKDFSKFSESVFRCFKKNQSVLIQGLVNYRNKTKDTFYLIETLTDFTYSKMIAWLVFKEDTNLKVQFDYEISNLFKCLLNLDSNEVRYIAGGRVRTFEDLLYVSDHLDVDIHFNDKLDKIFKAAKKYKLVYNGDVNKRPVKFMANKDFVNLIKHYTLPKELKHLKELYDDYSCLQKCLQK